MYVAEPEAEEVVLYLIAYRLAAFLGTDWTLLLDDAVLFFEYLHLSSKTLHAESTLYLALRNIALSYLVKDTEIRAIVFAKLLDKYFLAFIHKVAVTA